MILVAFESEPQDGKVIKAYTYGYEDVIVVCFTYGFEDA